ncbi:MAG: hypothetical protein ABR616_16125, partial [Dermatophilaceae bacterium]
MSLLVQGQHWAIEWAWTTSWMNGIMVLFGPAVGAVAAAESVYWHRQAAGSIGRAPRRQALVAHAARAVAVATWAALAHLTALLVAWALAIRAHGTFGWLDMRSIAAVLV